MITRALAVLALLSTVVPAPPAEAVPFEIRVQVFDSWGAGANIIVSDVLATGPAPATLSGSGSGSSAAPGSDPATGTTTGSAGAAARFDASGLKLGVAASTNVEVSGSAGGLQYTGTSLGASVFRDQLTLLGGASGTTGFLRAAFDLGGSLVAGQDPPGIANVVGQASVIIGALDSVGSFTVVNSSQSSLLGPGGFPDPLPASLTSDYRYTFGEPGLFGIELVGLAVGQGGLPGAASASTDFLSTLSLTSVQVLDADLSAIPNGQVISAEQLSYPFAAPPAPVPEPTTLLLFGTTAAGLGLARWRQRSRRRQP